VVKTVQLFVEMGFKITATSGTAAFLKGKGIEAEVVFKVYEDRPNICDLIKNRRIDLVINTVSGKKTITDSKELRQTTLLYGIPYTTTISGAWAMAQAVQALRDSGMSVQSIQEYYKG